MIRSLQTLAVFACCLFSMALCAAAGQNDKLKDTAPAAEGGDPDVTKSRQASAPDDGEQKVVPNLPVRVIAGERAGQTLCLARQHMGGHAVGIYAQTADASLLKLIKEVEGKLAARPGLGGYLIVIPENKKVEPTLKELLKENAIQKVDVGISDQALEEFNKAFSLPPKATLTVYYTVERKVKYQRSFEPGKLDAKAIGEVMSKIGELAK